MQLRYHNPNASWTVFKKQQLEYMYEAIIGCEVVTGLIQGFRFLQLKLTK